MIGSMLGGYMLDHFDGNRSLALAMLGAGIGTLLIPTAPRVWTLALCVSTAGLAMGIVDTGCAAAAAARGHAMPVAGVLV